VGDLLVSFGDFLYNTKPLPRSGITEESWSEELRAIVQRDFNGNMNEVSAKTQIPVARVEVILNDPFGSKPNAKEALILASVIKAPLHPAFTFFLHSLTAEQLLQLRHWLLGSQVKVQEGLVIEIVGSQNEAVKKLLERICVPHVVAENKIMIQGDDALIFASCLGLESPKARVSHSKTVSEIIQELSGIVVREKAPTTVGARMGRPEKAKRREMRPMVHVLFPVGLAGGSQRNLVEAMKKGTLEAELVQRRCPACRESVPSVKKRPKSKMFVPSVAELPREKFAQRVEA